MRIIVAAVALLILPPLTLAADKPTYRVAVTIDDLPATRQQVTIEEKRKLTKDLLEALTARKIPAIGFVNENKLLTNGKVDPQLANLLELWLNAGMELGNHTYAHLDLHRITVDEFKKQIVQGEKTTAALLAKRNQKIKWFRHPFLHTGRSRATRDEVESFLTKRGVRVAPVTMDNSEWIYARAFDVALTQQNEKLQAQIARDYVDYMMRKDAYYRAQSKRFFGREIAHTLLIHANALNARAFRELADRMLEAGVQFISLEEALKDPAYKSRDEYFGPAGLSWLDRWALTAGKKGDFFAAEPKTQKHILDLAGVDSE